MVVVTQWPLAVMLPRQIPSGQVVVYPNHCYGGTSIIYNTLDYQRESACSGKKRQSGAACSLIHILSKILPFWDLQGSYSSLKTWKVMDFFAVLECPWKAWNLLLWNVLENFMHLHVPVFAYDNITNLYAVNILPDSQLSWNNLEFQQ